MRYRTWPFVAGLFSAALAGSAAFAADPPAPFRPDRTAEDYGYLRDPA